MFCCSGYQNHIVSFQIQYDAIHVLRIIMELEQQTHRMLFLSKEFLWPELKITWTKRTRKKDHRLNKPMTFMRYNSATEWVTTDTDSALVGADFWDPLFDRAQRSKSVKEKQSYML